MPKLSDTMEEGTIVEWKKKSGDEVKAGEVLAEVESDKATFDLEAESDGVLQILVDQGVPAKIGAPIARIGEFGETPAQPRAKPAAAQKAAPAEAKPEEPQVQAETEPKAPEAEAEEPAPTTAAAKREIQDGRQNGREVKASPLARRLADEMGVDLASLKGSGPEGRIVKEDVLAAGSSRQRSERRRPQPATERAPGADVEVIEPSRMQATIARRMAEAKSTI